RRVVQHDGSILHLRKVGVDYDPSDRIGAMNHLQERQALGEIVTGLLYVDSSGQDMHTHLNTVEKPLNQLGDAYLCPGSKALEALNATLR
ncbi:MAG: hypothetical protein AzoDbin1_03848, partial [Azoarcus sp.]|nr:hypothetical protein [Azoarcus sp.]